VYIPPKSVQVNFSWGKNYVRTSIEQFYSPQKLLYPPKQISGYAPEISGALHDESVLKYQQKIVTPMGVLTSDGQLKIFS